VVAVQTPKLCGEWARKYDLLLTDADMERLKDLGNTHRQNTHLTPGWGLDVGCVAVKKVLTINAWGDAMPCPGMRFGLGNILEVSLREILKKGMGYFGRYQPRCMTGQDAEFNRRYVSKTWGVDYPVPIEDIGVK
jgi:hypothetical protein